MVLHEIPPNGQGLAVHIALAILAYRDVPPLASAQAVHQQIEAMKLESDAASAHSPSVRMTRLRTTG